MENKIYIKGARVHNLQDIELDIPHEKLIVVTGLSGSGKSTLAFDTIFAEGQRRYVESLSAYARQFLGRISKPDVDIISGIAPAIAIEQKVSSRNPRSTVGTVTEIYGGLGDGNFDICFGSKNPKYDFRWVTLSADRFYAVLPKGYPSDSDVFPISGFNGTKFLMPGLGFDDDISAVFSENNVRPFVTPTYVDDPAIISMVEHNLGISLLSELILSSFKGNVKILPIVPEVYRVLSIATRADIPHSPFIKRLISITKDFVKNLQLGSFGDFQ